MESVLSVSSSILILHDIDHLIGGPDQAAWYHEGRGSGPQEERTLESDGISSRSFPHFCPTYSPYPRYSSRFSGKIPPSRSVLTNRL